MNCPKCGYGWGKVIDARKQGITKRRRRECSGCGCRFTTYEILDTDIKKLKQFFRVAKPLLAAILEIEEIDK